MDYITVLLVGFGLSMDAFAVSISTGISIKANKLKGALKTAAFFGFFQFAMPLLGFLLAGYLSSFIQKIDHWVAFALLVFIGAKMIIEACNNKEEAPADPLNTATLLLLAVATSIDALAAGFTLSLLGANVFISAMIIGVITFTLSFTGVLAGKKLGGLFKKRAEIAGGSVLIILGLKTLLEHLLG